MREMTQMVWQQSLQAVWAQWRIRVPALSLVVVLLSAFAPAGTAQDLLPMEATEFRPLDIAPDQATGPEIMPLIEEYYSDFPGTEGSEELEIKLTREEGGYEVYIKRTGYADDSWAGEEFVGHIVREDDGNWTLKSLNVRDLCYRGVSESGLCR
jgi:hypothetical protein